MQRVIVESGLTLCARRVGPFRVTVWPDRERFGASHVLV